MQKTKHHASDHTGTRLKSSLKSLPAPDPPPLSVPETVSPDSTRIRYTAKSRTPSPDGFAGQEEPVSHPIRFHSTPGSTHIPLSIPKIFSLPLLRKCSNFCCTFIIISEKHQNVNMNPIKTSDAGENWHFAQFFHLFFKHIAQFYNRAHLQKQTHISSVENRKSSCMRTYRNFVF